MLYFSTKHLVGDVMKLDLLKGQSGTYFIIIGMTALSFSIIIPVMALFLVKELNIEPSHIGLYTVSTALSTMLISQFLGGLVDRGVDSKRLYLVSVTAMALGGFSFSVITQFWQALIVGMCFMSFGGASMPLLFAMIRRYAERSGKNSTRLSSQMRASMSLLWVIGPAIGFASMEHVGMRTNFLLAGVISMAVLLFAIVRLPPDVKPQESRIGAEQGQSAKVPIPKAVWVLGSGIFFASLANAVYLNSMPIFMTDELGMPLSFPGLLLGMTAALEIPIMLFAAHWAGEIGKVKMMRISFLFGLLFYVGMEFLDGYWYFLALQLLNGIFFGTFAGLGVTVLQDFAPSIVGKLSAFYANCMSIGNMCGTSILGIVAQYYGFRNTLYVSMASILISFVIFMLFERYSKNQQDHLLV
jgi:SET family sugar efflux transporter-like MFS transporter